MGKHFWRDSENDEEEFDPTVKFKDVHINILEILVEKSPIIVLKKLTFRGGGGVKANLEKVNILNFVMASLKEVYKDSLIRMDQKGWEDKP